LWTLKEAYTKAVGKGLALGLHSFSITFASEQEARVKVHGSSEATTRWSLIRFLPAEGYTAAVAVARPKSQLMYWDWSPTATGCAGIPNNGGTRFPSP
jgi:4'-phosphopantetheinyl transferase